MRVRHMVVVLALGLAALGLGIPRTANACGGFFCSQTPIDQQAERIIFAKDGRNITAWIQVVYSGSAEDFAWVVPVSSVPIVETAEDTIFQNLDRTTAPVITPPTCMSPVFAGAADDGDAMAENSGGSGRSDEVIVYASAEVGPYHYDVVGSENAGLLINWLNDNDYIITEPMEPMVEHYVHDDMLFLAMKLQAGQEVNALAPVKMTYEGDNPVVPIRLTGVAADPNMGVLVWILGEGRGVPANYLNVEIDHDEIVFDMNLRSNYRTVVSRTIDRAGGHAFVTEYAGTTEALLPSLFDEETTELLSDYRYVTRLYTTISPEEMTVDPMFTVNPALPDVSNIIDLSARDCQEDTPSPCEFNHCGPSASCYEVNGEAACLCPQGFVARGVTDPVRGTGITCTPEGRDMLGEAIPMDPCATMTCGEFGQCVAINGTATCSCDQGYGAVDDVDGLGCVSLESGVVIAGPVAPTTPPYIPPGRVNNSEGDSDSTGCSVGATPGSQPVWPALVGLIVGLLAIRRRR